MKSSIVRSILISVICILLISSAVLGYYAFKKIGMFIEIIPGEYEIQMYADPEMLTPVYVIQEAIHHRGTTSEYLYYLRNEGLNALSFGITAGIKEPGWGEITMVPDIFELSAGENTTMLLYIEVYDYAPLETAEADLLFY